MKVYTRPRFYLDVAEEVQQLALRAGPQTALEWHSAVENTIRELRQHPHLGRLRKDLGPHGIRSWRVTHFRRWLIFYLIRDNTLVLLRVRYGMMDLTAVALLA